MAQRDDELKRRLDTSEYRLRVSEADHHMDVETALVKLEEEQQRYDVTPQTSIITH